MADIINEYRNLLWGVIVLMIVGGYTFTGLSLVYLYAGINANTTRILLLDRDIREVRERQIKALVEREAINKEVFNELDRLKKK